jgi:hypothetical protein
VEFITAGAAIFILSYMLLLRPIIGVADNGDFARIMNSTGLFYLSNEPSERYFGFVNRLYGIGYTIPFGGRYLSTELPLVLLSIFIGKSVPGIALFDIRILASIYILAVVFAFFYIARCCRRRAGGMGLFPALLAVFIFCDIGYTSYFNSLYGEPVTFVFLLLAAAMVLMMAVEEKPSLWMLVLLCTSLFFFAGAKVQNSPAGILAALLIIRLSGLGKNAAWRRISIAAAVSVAAVSLVCYASVSKDIKTCNKYQSVFYGVLRGSPDPAADLSELGLDPSLAVLAGTNYFMEKYPIDIKTPEFRDMLFDKVSYAKVAGYYLRHPRRFLQKLEYAAENGFKLKQGFGNFEKNPGIHYKQTSNIFGFWSDFKLYALPHTLLFVLIFYLAAVLILVYEYMRAVDFKSRLFIEFMGLVVLTGIMQFILPVIGDGDADLSKHLFLFNISFDMLFAAGLTYLAQKVVAAVRYIKGRILAARLQTD